MVHAQAAHMVNIYEIGESDEEDDSSTNSNSRSHKLDKTNGESHNNINGSSCNGTAMHSNENVSLLEMFSALRRFSDAMKNFYGWWNNKNSFDDRKTKRISSPEKKLNDKEAQIFFEWESLLKILFIYF